MKPQSFSVQSLAIFALIFLVSSTTPYPASAKSKSKDTLNQIVSQKTLRIGAEVGFKPFVFRNKKGKVVGFDIDLAQLAAKEMGVKLKVVNTEWDGIIPALLTNKFDILMGAMTVTSKRNLRVNFANPYIVVGQTILIKKSIKAKIKNYKDLNSSKFIVVSKLGSTGEFTIKRLMPKAKIRTYQTSNEAVLEVLNGRADAFVQDKPFNTVLVASTGKGKVVHLDEPFTFEPLAWAVRRDDPNVINWLNNFLMQIKNDGRYQKIYHKWFKSDAWMKSE